MWNYTCHQHMSPIACHRSRILYQMSPVSNNKTKSTNPSYVIFPTMNSRMWRKNIRQKSNILKTNQCIYCICQEIWSLPYTWYLFIWIFFDIRIALGVFIPNTSWFFTDALNALILFLISAGGTKWAGIIFFSFFTFWTFFVWAGEHGAKNEFSCGIYVYPYAVAWYISR